MWCFPSIGSGTRSWRLPLAGHTALGLYEVVTVGGAERLRDWLALDPPLLLWTVAHVREAPFEHTWQGSLADLAEWACPHLCAWLAEERPDVGVSRRPRKKWAQLAEAALELAARSVEAVAEDGLRERAYLLGVMSTAPEWLASCGPAVAASEWEQGRGPFPRELARRLTAARKTRGRSDDPVIAAVRQARRRGSSQASQAPARLPPDLGHARDLWQRACAPAAVAPAADGPEVVWGAGSAVPAQALMVVARKFHQARQHGELFDRALEEAKLESMRQLAYGASHEINNPLANIATRAEHLLLGESDPHRRYQLAMVRAQAYRAHEMISDLMLFARPPELERAWTPAREIISEAINPWMEDAAYRNVRVMVRDVPEARVHVDSVQVIGAIGAIMRNALEAIGDDGQITVEAHTDGRDWVVSVRDDGPGIPDAIRPHLFDPYFSGREAGRGHGLGLSKAWVVVRAHGGRIDVDTSTKGGARFVLHFPDCVEAKSGQTEETTGMTSGRETSWKRTPSDG